MPSKIEKDIHNTLAYFAYSQYPLTIFEICKWQYRPSRIYKYSEIKEILKVSKWLKVRIGHSEGMYGLGTDMEIDLQVSARKRRFLDAVKKQKKVCKVIQYISRISSVQGVAICNSLAYHFTREKSDIDLFIITTHGRVWTARLWTVGPLVLLRQRPGESKKNPVDISFFVSEKSMNLSELQIDNDDPYLAFWIKNLTAVYGSDELWDRFFHENRWTDESLPNAHRPKRAYQMQCNTRFSFIPCLLSEKTMRFIQLLKMPYRLKVLANEGSCVVINDDMLKFHTTDRRLEISEAFKRKCV